MSYQTLEVATDNQLATITLNRPDKRNALSAEMIVELTQALKKLSDDDSLRVIALRGAGSAFCAGADLSAIQAMQRASFDDNLADGNQLKEMFHRLYACPKPTIAVVHGPALAGGAGLASCCDFVIASKEASFGYPEVKIGFVAALVMVLLTRQVGERAARDLILTGRTLTAEQALEIGLINRVVENDQLEQACNDLTKTLSKNSPTAMSLSKELLVKVWDGKLEDNMSAAAEFNAKARATDDCKEGIAAFLEKRKPRWLG